MKTLFLTLFVSLAAFLSVAQVAPQDTAQKRNAYGIWLLPSGRDNICGIALGLFGSEVICNKPNVRKSHGVNLQLLGQGFFIPLNPRIFSYKNLFSTDTSWMLRSRDSVNYKAIHNGLLISTFGTMTDVSNGLVISGWCSVGFRANGLIINVLANKYTLLNGLALSLSNQSYEANGIQIGLINRTRKLRGFQFGLWNVNDKRKLPLLNWNFKNP